MDAWVNKLLFAAVEDEKNIKAGELPVPPVVMYSGLRTEVVAVNTIGTSPLDVHDSTKLPLNDNVEVSSASNHNLRPVIDDGSNGLGPDEGCGTLPGIDKTGTHTFPLFCF